MPSPNRGRTNGANHNREIDAIDLSANLEILPAPADPTFSPLSQVGRPVAPDPDPAPPTVNGEQHHKQPEPDPEPTQSTPGPRRRRRSTEPAVEAVRSERDQTRDRLVHEALLARGLDPDTFTKKAVPRGGKHRPTIELTPQEYAAIQIATALRPDLFGRSLVSFIRTCATNWETIAATLDPNDEANDHR